MTVDATSPPGEARPLVSPRKTAATRWPAYASLLGSGCFTIAVLALHLMQPERSPLNEAVSFYVHGTHSWLLTVGLLAGALDWLPCCWDSHEPCGVGSLLSAYGAWGYGALAGSSVQYFRPTHPVTGINRPRFPA